MTYYSTQCISKFLTNNEKRKGTVFIGLPGSYRQRDEEL